MKILAAAAALALAPAGAAFAQSSSLAAGVNLGTPGIGAELQLQLSDSLVLRGDADWLSYDRDEDYSGVPYGAELKSMTAGVFADWHPGATPFLVSAGAYFGERKVNLDATPSGPVNIGGQTFTPAQVGRITGRAEMSKFQPFVGLGFDNTFTSGSGWGFRALAGVAFSKDPDVSLAASGGTLSNDPTFQSLLRAEEADVREDAKGIRYYPILQVGLTRRF
jgi:hypothetical protein